jgi:hypothetical protein
MAVFNRKSTPVDFLNAQCMNAEALRSLSGHYHNVSNGPSCSLHDPLLPAGYISRARETLVDLCLPLSGRPVQAPSAHPLPLFNEPSVRLSDGGSCAPGPEPFPGPKSMDKAQGVAGEAPFAALWLSIMHLNGKNSKETQTKILNFMVKSFAARSPIFLFDFTLTKSLRISFSK